MEIRGLDKKKRRSSANAAIFGERVLSNWRPEMSGLFCTVRRNGSRVKIKIRGDRGHPWRVPLVISNDCDRCPFTFTLAEGQEYMAWIQCIIPRPRNHRVSVKKVQSTLSNVFSALVERSSRGILCFCATYIRLSALVVLSLASLIGTNPTWSEWTSWGIRPIRRRESILVNIFRSTFSNEIGQ